MRRVTDRLTLLFLVAALIGAVLAPTAALAHQTKAVGDGQYQLVVGFVTEPIYTDQRNGLDLRIRHTENLQPIEFLEDTIFAEIIAPDGLTKRTLPIRARYGMPGAYTSDIVLTQPGEYQVRIWGRIYDVEFEEVFNLHEVGSLSDLRFP